MFVFAGESRQQELRGQSVHALTSDGHGGALAIVDGHSMCQRGSEGLWSTIATHERALACCVTVGKAIYVGTDDDAGMLYLIGNSELTRPPGFDTVAGRDAWFAGSAVVKKSICRTTVGGSFDEGNLGWDYSFRQCSRRWYLTANERRCNAATDDRSR